MELKEFVAETLQQIMDGVGDAQDHAGEQGGAIAPKVSYRQDQGFIRMRHAHTDALVEEVTFDVAVTTAQRKDRKLGIAVLAASVGLGGQTEKQTRDERVSRVQFAVPVCFPVERRGT